MTALRKPANGAANSFAAAHRPLASRYRLDAGNGRREESGCTDGANVAVVDPAKGAARSRQRPERDRSAIAYAQACFAKPGFYIHDRPGLFGHDPAGGYSAQHSGDS